MSDAAAPLATPPPGAPPATAAEVARRQVFYIPGFDPFPPRRYRELYRREGAAQAAISGHALELARAPRAGAQGWRVRAVVEGAEVQADVEVLVWDDIVRTSMAQGIVATYGQLLFTLWVYLSRGAFLRMIRLRKGPTIAALYPVAMLLAQLGVAAAAALVARWAVMAGLAAAGLAGPSWAAAAAAGWAVVAVAALWAVLAGFRRIDKRLFAHYLMHDYAFTARHRGANPPELDARLTAFAGRIAEALADPGLDEVLVVGHSSGAHLGVMALAETIRAGRVPVGGPALGLLTLGHVVPMAAFLPRANRLREDLRFLSRRDELFWLDVTAPGDGCAFALCDPVAISGAGGPGKRWPLVISAAFTHTLAPERWRALRWRFFRLHFQYLCAFDRPHDYDYFAITAGPQTLAGRFAGRAPSPSVVRRNASGFAPAP